MSRNRRSKKMEFEQWTPLAKKVVGQSLALRWNDSLEIYSYVTTIPLAEALALEARRVGSDTHITLMTDDLWFTSMQELPVKWLRAPSPAEIAINKSVTAYIYLGGPQDARRMRSIPPEKFDANSLGNVKQEEPRRKRRVRLIDLSIGRVCPERADAYGINYELWRKNYEAALAVNLADIRKAGETWRSMFKERRKIRITSDAGTDLTLQTKAREPMIEDGIISDADRKHGFVSTSLPAGKIVYAVQPTSAQGKVRFTDPVYLMGRSVKGLRLTFESGRLVDWRADAHAETLTSVLDRSRTSANRLRWFSIGLNPAAYPCLLDNSIVKDDVGIGLGPNPQLEPSTVGSELYFDSTIGLANVETTD